MASSYQAGAQAAEALFDALTAEGIIGSSAATTGQATVAVAHGLSAAPDFVIAQGSAAIAEGGAAGIIGWSATATTLTITRADTAAEETISYIAGVLR